MNPSPQPSARPGMGAVLHPDGVTFRVWAPNAASVAVAGSFNNWSQGAHPLAREDGGYWSADVPGVEKGATYKFVIQAQDGSTLWRRDPYARDVEHSNGDCVVVDPAFVWPDDDGFRMPSWNELVIYEVHVGTFNGHVDGKPGTLGDVAGRLDYLSDLGVNCIQLMPVWEFPMDKSLGYNPSHIFTVEQAYGGPASLKQLVVEAHRKGIAVILDVVYNHFGPSDLDLWQFDGWSENGKGGIYFYNDWRSKTPWGDTRPDYGRREVRQFIRDNALSWIHEHRMDGLRWDVTNYIRNVTGGSHPGDDLPEGWELMRSVNREISGEQPWKLILAEDMQGDPRVTHPDGAGFDSQWDAGFIHPVRKALIARDDAHRDMHDVAGAIRNQYGDSALHRIVFTESHDEVRNGRARIPHDVWPEQPGSWASRKRSTLGAALVFTSPGIPMIFQGQEFVEDGWFEAEDALDWAKLDRFPGIHALYRDLMRLRRNWWNHTRGLRGQQVNVHHVRPDEKLVGFHRWENGGPGDDVVVLANFSHRPLSAHRLGFPRGGEWKVRFNSDWNGYSPDFGSHPAYDVRAEGGEWDDMPFSAEVGIGPYTAVIWSQD